MIYASPLLVAPFVGAWIEMSNELLALSKIEVAPFVGAWIEIYITSIWFIVIFGRSVRRSVD